MTRILSAIDTYRLQTEDHSYLINNQAVSVYLKHHLSRQDWFDWKQVAAHRIACSHTLKEPNSLRQTQTFRQVMGQYKRAVFERLQAGQQTGSDPG